MPLHALSVGVAIDVWKPRSGAVHSSFEHALNLLVEGELWTVLGARRQDSAFGIRLAPGARPGACDARVAEPVHVRAGYLRLGQEVIDCRAAARWAPTPWAARASGFLARIERVEQRALGRAWPRSAELAAELANALRGSDAELARAVRQSVGFGPGLTPAGDDVLVGMLAVFTSGADGLSARAFASRLAVALTAVSHTTPDISRHLLDQAARGLPGRALHELGKALWEGAPDDALATALESVLVTGSTSGADASLGLCAALRLSYVADESPT